MTGDIFLSRRMQFAKVARHGTIIAGERWQLRYLANRKKTARLGVNVPKRLVRHAVHRNRLRRVLREAFRQHWRTTLLPVDILLAPTRADTAAAARDDCARLFATLRS